MHRPTGKVVVTGGAGFIGSHLVDRLLADGCPHIVVIDNLRRGRIANLEQHATDPRLRFVAGDIRDPATVTSAIAGATHVYHLAAQSTVMGAVEDVQYSFSTNVIGTFNVLYAAAEARVGCVVFASSREVYGDPIDLPVDEGQPLLAINAYGASKVAGEAYCRAFRHTAGLQTHILRLANVYGPRDYDRVIPRWVSRARAGQELEVYGGKQLIDFVWVGQVVEALVCAADLPGPLPPINVGSGTGTPIIDLARRILRLSGSHGHLKLLQARPVEVTRFVADITRMRQMLRIEPADDPLANLRQLVPGAAPDPLLTHAVAALR
jgi:nucleoside-diphosphate-sugar epimerase